MAARLAARHRRTLWLLFLERDGTQADHVMPVDGLPDRPGAPRRTDADRQLPPRAAARGGYATPVRMLCLATPEGVRELGLVTPMR